MRHLFARKPAGIPAGGQFATTPHTEAEAVELPEWLTSDDDSPAAPEGPMSARRRSHLSTLLHGAVGSQREVAADRANTPPEERQIMQARLQIDAEAYLAVTEEDVSYAGLPSTAATAISRIVKERPVTGLPDLPPEQCDRIADYFISRAMYNRSREKDFTAEGVTDTAGAYSAAADRAEYLAQLFYARDPHVEIDPRFRLCFRQVVDEVHEIANPRRVYAEACRRVTAPPTSPATSKVSA